MIAATDGPSGSDADAMTCEQHSPAMSASTLTAQTARPPIRPGFVLVRAKPDRRPRRHFTVPFQA